ncbi:hypothetical protein BKA70DRAFT_1563346 [Coprinopsis sp. MPI-PUGE-AT-0042]|nr:hypothetical protein BKA70DRAFT_1563346 [Coprinopsis sp. MPI-PUGE-AT-0042]
MELELEAYIKSNEETPSMLIPICLEQIRELEVSTAIVDEKVQTLLSTLEVLKGERSGLNARKAALGSLLAPIRKLPNELLSVIFRNTIQQPAVMGRHDRRTLTQVRCVCKRWDVVATSTPTFWRNFQVDRLEYRCRTAGLINGLKTWFSRAGVGAPLRLSLGAIDHPHNKESRHQFARFFTSSRWNWYELHLNLETTTLLRIFENITLKDSKPWRFLTRLALNITPIGHIDIDLGDQILPSLNHLNLSFGLYEELAQEVDPEDFPHAIFRHTSVAMLCLTYSTIFNHRWLPRLLNPESFPALRHLALVDIEIRGNATQPLLDTHPTILHVETLVVRGDMTSFALNYLTLPSLKSLQLITIQDSYSGSNTFGASDSLVEFVKRSKLHLETISLEKANLPPEINAKIVRRTRSCQTLQVALPDFINLLDGSARTSRSLRTIICTEPIFDGRPQWWRPEEPINHLHTWHSPHTLTIVSPDPKPDSTRFEGGSCKGLERLLQDGLVKFVQSVDELGYDLRVIPPYKAEGPFYMPVHE